MIRREHEDEAVEFLERNLTKIGSFAIGSPVDGAVGGSPSSYMSRPRYTYTGGRIPNGRRLLYWGGGFVQSSASGQVPMDIAASEPSVSVPTVPAEEEAITNTVPAEEEAITNTVPAEEEAITDKEDGERRPVIVIEPVSRSFGCSKALRKGLSHVQARYAALWPSGSKKWPSVSVPTVPAEEEAITNEEDGERLPGRECSICYENSSTKALGRWVRTPCDHYYHEKCITKWLTVWARQNVREGAPCPDCRDPVEELLCGTPGCCAPLTVDNEPCQTCTPSSKDLLWCPDCGASLTAEPCLGCEYLARSLSLRHLPDGHLQKASTRRTDGIYP